MKVFLSYASSDQAVARDLAGRLREKGYELWFDEEQVLPGDNFAKRVGEALDESEAMVVLISPEAMKSRYVREEINFALVSQRYEGRLIPVIVKPTDDAPWILDKLQVNPIRSRNRADLSRQVIKALGQP